MSGGAAGRGSSPPPSARGPSVSASTEHSGHQGVATPLGPPSATELGSASFQPFAPASPRGAVSSAAAAIMRALGLGRVKLSSDSVPKVSVAPPLMLRGLRIAAVVHAGPVWAQVQHGSSDRVIYSGTAAKEAKRMLASQPRTGQVLYTAAATAFCPQ